MIRVLFVCMGNICRSPMAEAVFQHMVNEAGLSAHFTIDSAGTGNWHEGEMAHQGTRTVLKKHNIPYDGRARQINPQDWAKFDYILAMDETNLSAVVMLRPESAKVEGKGHYIVNDTPVEANLFLHYAHADKTINMVQVPDPYYTGEYDATYDLVTIGAKALLTYIRKKHKI
ncbi:MAG: low molecular weight protein-tyrosine-phosphatase [bacterium]|nr:low molecular weight protein-tyrosine-phosphatase [bacterium]